MTSYLFFVIIVLIIADNSSRWCSMVQRLVLKNPKRCIYQIEESNMKFYMMIPNSLKVSLVLGLYSHVDDEMIQRVVQNSDQAVVVPIIEVSILEGIQKSQEKEFYYLDQYFSNLINLSHKILVHNHIEVTDIIYFSSEEYANFSDWFVVKYQGRVQKTSLDIEAKEVVQVPEALPREAVSAETMTLTKADVEEPVKSELTVDKEEVSSTKPKEPGFVSYVLLGVIVAVISLVFLYLII